MARGPRDISERGVYALLAAAALIVIWLVAFVVKNTDSVEVSFVIFDAQASLIWVMLICIVLGILIGLVISTLYHRTREPRRTATALNAPPATPEPPAPGGDPGIY